MASIASTDIEISTYQRLHPRAYLAKFIAEKLRPDGRTLAEFRLLEINSGSITTAEGSALVRLGETTVVCGVKAEIAEPELDAPSQGFIVPNVDISAICSPKFKPGPPSEDAQVISELLYRTISKVGMLPLESLCISPGKAVWAVYVDAICINYDGNAFDTTLLAMVAALKNTKLPQATYDEENRITLCSKQRLIPLEITAIPSAMTFGLFDGQVISDPTSFEEPLLDSSVTVILSENKVVSVSQLGSHQGHSTSAPTAGLIETCVATARARQTTVIQALQ